MNNRLMVNNYGGFNALLLGDYTLHGEKVEFRSPDMLLFQSYSIDIPEGATLLHLVPFFYDTFAGYRLISRELIPDIVENECFNFYGTIFNASFQQVPC